MTALKPTTVRFVPGEATSPDELAIAALHLYAYETAAGLVEAGNRVLDVGFGEGYGSKIFSASGADYRGVEVDPEIVDTRERVTARTSRPTKGYRSPHRTARSTSSSRSR